ncbi:MAG: hypothetical protein ACI96M_002877 [Candidatus Azotimanducaceae bacterium]|jgi:hypothetical protein
MSRNRESGNESFDLLLDTMCNMFGGMVLIAILLAIISQETGKASPRPDSSSDGEGVEYSVATDQDAQVVQLRALVAVYEEQLTKSTNSLEHVSKEEALRLRERLVLLRRENEGLSKKVATIINDHEAKRESVAALMLKVTTIESKVVESRPQTVPRNLRMPRLHKIDKIPVFLAVKNGALFSVSDTSNKRVLFAARGYDLESVILENEPGGLRVIELRPGRGQNLSKEALPGRLGRQMLTNLDTSTEFLSFAVYDDSYGTFNVAKEYFSELGFEFNWTRMSGDQLIKVSPVESLEAQ